MIRHFLKMFSINTHSLFFSSSRTASLSQFPSLMSLKLFMCCGSHLIYSIRHLEHCSTETPVFNSGNRQKHLIVSHNQSLSLSLSLSRSLALSLPFSLTHWLFVMFKPKNSYSIDNRWKNNLNLMKTTQRKIQYMIFQVSSLQFWHLCC